MGGEDDLPAIGLQQTAILHECFQRALVDGDVEQPVAGDVERYPLARRKRDGTQIGANDAAVIDPGAEQGNIAAICGDSALVEDRSAAAGKGVMPGHEIRIGKVEGRCDEPADIDVGALAEDDAVRIDQEHLAVRGERTEDG